MVLQLGKQMRDEDLESLAHVAVNNGTVSGLRIHISIPLSSGVEYKCTCPGGLHIPAGKRLSEAVESTIRIMRDLISGRIVVPLLPKTGRTLVMA